MSRPISSVLRTRPIAKTLPLLTVMAASLSLAAIAPAFAQSAPNVRPVSGAVRMQRLPARTQRPLADDFAIDQALVTPMPEPAAAKTIAEPVPAPAQGPEVLEADNTDQHIASLGPAMRPLHPFFAPIWPSRGEITTHFGESGPLSPRGHSGLDIAADSGTAILAADDGDVLKAYWNEEGYGGLVVIVHVSGYETWYGHMSRFSVEPGEHVRRGERIGSMGSTGYSTGPHLHFEVRRDGELHDPLEFLRESALQPPTAR
jgi:murein DD-endopeptidase MepM/ murein hydrolase activator NlpD